MSFRRAAFDFVGEFSEQLGRGDGNAAGCEETEFCIRAQALFPLSRILFEPSAIVYHHVSGERAAWRYFRKRCLAEGRSKASMTTVTGARSGLSSEALHTARALPAAFLGGLGNAIRERDVAGLRRSIAVLTGLSLAVCGYLGGRVVGGGRAHSDPPRFAPVRVVDIDVDRPIEGIAARDPRTGERCGSAYCLVRRAGRPVRIMELPLYGTDVTADRLWRVIGDTQDTPSIPAAARTVELPEARVIVATRDRPDTLARCLESVLASDYPSFEVVVVDNAPASDATKRMMERFSSDGRVRYRREDRPGLGCAHNCGLVDAMAAVIAITDDDVVVDRSWLFGLCRPFGASGRVGCTTGLILPLELATRAQYWTERHGRYSKGLLPRLFDLEENRPSDPLFPFAAGIFGSGANMAFLTSALRSIGGFDNALGVGTLARGGDDLAAFAAIIRAGYQLRYEPAAIVWHAHRREEAGMERQAYAYGVGLGAYLTKLVVDDPKIAFAFLRAAPYGFAHVMSPTSEKNSRLPSDYPAQLWWNERLGMVMGVPSYVRSRRAAAQSG
jgi:GT2 family glycosyltransferase